MSAEPGRVGWVLPGTALTTFVLVQALRVWFPTVLFVVGDAGSTSAITMGIFALGCLLVGPVLAVLGSSRPTRSWQIGTFLLAAAHAAFLLTGGGFDQALTASLAVIGGTMALTAVAGLPGPGAGSRTGIVLGLAGELIVHAALGSRTLAWQEGVLATSISLSLVVLLVVTVRGASRELRRRAPLANAGRAWPWLVLAPLFLLMLVLAGVPGRVAVATNWPPSVVAATVVAAQSLAVVAVLVGPRLAPLPATALGSSLVLVGAAGALPASGVPSVLAQVALAVGLALLAVYEAPTTDSSSARRRTAAAAGGIFGFGVLTFLYYAAYDLRLGFYNRAILLVAALGAAVLGSLVLRVRRTSRVRPAPGVRRVARLAAVLAMLVVATGVLRMGDGSAEPSPGTPGDEIRLMLFNLHMGYSADGTFSVPEIARVVQEHDPDILVLNEVDRGWLTTGGHDVLGQLQEELEGLHAVFAPGADEVWGNALLTRFPVSEVTTRRLPRGGDPMQRGQLGAVVEVAAGQQLGIVATHLSHVDDQGTTRLPQARSVAATVAWFRERDLPTAVLGDLNAGPDSAEIDTFRSFVAPTLPAGNPTWPSSDPEVQIDHVLVSPDLEVLDARVVESDASDHLPVVVTVGIAP